MVMRHSTPKYSICSTNYNNITSIEEALESILSQVDENFEMIVVDNYSTDGTLSILTRYAEQGRLKLILKRTTRGAGRQEALAHARGKYIIHIDLDDIWRPVFPQMLRYYHQYHEGKAMFTFGLVVAPRKLLLSAGGWRDLQRGEDIDMKLRLARIESCVSLPFNPWIERRVKKWNWLLRLFDAYKGHRDLLRAGISPFRIDTIQDWTLWYGFLGSFVIVCTALTAHLTYRLWPLFEPAVAPTCDVRSTIKTTRISPQEMRVFAGYLPASEEGMESALEGHGKRHNIRRLRRLRQDV
jgi:glycosyltransferase involved in cell wall biosynthesis